MEKFTLVFVYLREQVRVGDRLVFGLPPLDPLASRISPSLSPLSLLTFPPFPRNSRSPYPSHFHLIRHCASLSTFLPFPHQFFPPSLTTLSSSSLPFILFRPSLLTNSSVSSISLSSLPYSLLISRPSHSLTLAFPLLILMGCRECLEGL